MDIGKTLVSLLKFFVNLFDVSFREFITVRLLPLLFVLAILASGVQAVLVMHGCITADSIWVQLGAIPAGVIVFGLLVIACRVVLEMVIVVFRIAENTGVLADHLRENTSSD